jgi:aspartyl-tRNA synthetase
MEAFAKDTEKLELSSKESLASNGAESVTLSKNAMKKAAKEAEKAKKKADAAAKRAAEKAQVLPEAEDVSQGNYGLLPLIQSTTRTGKVFVFSRIDF